MAGIRDVAKLAGVSPATVSRVLNGTAPVDIEKQRRVFQAIDETGFKPNEVARALFRKSARCVGVIVPNIENPFFNELARVIEDACYQNGMRVMLYNSENDEEKELRNLEILRQLNADGVILITNSVRTGRAIRECGLPVVILDRRVEDCGELSFISAAHFRGGMLATERLVSCGCRRIVCLRGVMRFTSSQARCDGYRRVCEKYALEERFVEAGFEYEDGIAAAERLLQRFPDTDGILASNDLVALAVYKALARAGRRVPDEIQLIGFDDVRFSSLMTPELTTVRQPIPDMGHLAVRLLLDFEKGASVSKEHIFDVSLVERETTRKGA